MSLDTVDDIHQLEDERGALQALLGRVSAFATQHPGTGLADASGEHSLLLAEIQDAATATFCRASCWGFRFDEETDEGCDDDCGCTCGHELDDT